MTHCERVLEYMKQTGGITQAEAYDAFGCTRLSGRIYDLKKRGIGIRATNVAGFNRYGEPCHYARYTLESEQMAV